MKLIGERIKNDIKKYYPIIISLIFYGIVTQIVFRMFCPFRIIFGIPCAGCGMTRAIIYLITGDIQNAMRMNPSVVLWIVFFLWFFWNRYITGKKNKKVTIVCLWMVCVVTIVIYLYRISLLHCSG